MHIWRSCAFLLILAVGLTTAETLKRSAEIAAFQVTNGEIQTDSGKLDYETALRPAVLQKRSIANIARLLLGGNVPPNHPLVKYPEPKTWNLASNIMASLPGSSLSTSASSLSGGWAPSPNSAMSNIQQLFETKAKLLPYTGQVVQGITGLTSVKGDLLRQIHTISTQAIAQAAAEAAARALAGAAAAHAVTNSIAHAPNHGAQTGIKGGWSSYQNMYTNPPFDKTPGDMPGPPYSSPSAHINHYQAPPSFGSNPYSASPPQPPVSPIAYNTQPSQPYQNGYYTLYNTQQQSTSSAQTPYTPAPPVAHARPTLSPSTLIATTPSGYSPSFSTPIVPILKNSSSIVNSNSNNNGDRSKYARNFDDRPFVEVTYSSSNNTPLPSFRRTVPAGIFGRHAAQPSSTSSLLSTISSLLSASTAAYNSAFTGTPPSYYAPVQQSSAVFPNLLPSGSAPIPATPSIHSHPSSISSSPSAASVLSSGISSSANVYANNGYQQQSANSVSQGSGHYGSNAGSHSPGHFYQQPTPGSYFGASETRPAAVNAPSYSFGQNVAGHAGANYAQSGANSYIAHAIQSSPQFTGGFGAGPAGSAAVSGIPSPGYGTASYSTSGGGFNGPVAGSGYPGYNGGPGSSNGHVGGWNTQHAGPSASASSWPSPASNVHSPGYPSPPAGNANNPSGGYGRPTTQFPVAAGSAPLQQAYPAVSQNAYQSSAPGAYAQTQQPVHPQAYAQQTNQYGANNNGHHQQQRQQYQSAPSSTNGVGGLRNSNLNYNGNKFNNNYQRHDSHDQNQSASTMGNDYDDIDYDDDHHHSHQQAQRRNKPAAERPSKTSSYSSSRYPSSSKKRPFSKRPSITQQAFIGSSKKPSSSIRGEMRHHNGENDKRVIPTGSKKGSHFDSSVDVVDMNYERESGDQYYNSEENRNNDKNRWRTKNSSGQWANPFHNHNSNGRWSGKANHSKQTSTANVRGHGQGSERPRPQSGQSTGKNHRSKKVSGSSVHETEKQYQHQQMGKPKAETTSSTHHGGRVRSKQQQWKQQPTEYKSRDVYTTLPEYVFRVGERTDVFLRPTGKWKHRNSVRGRLSPRYGETSGSGSGSGSSSAATQEDMETAYSSYIESISKEAYDYSEKNLEKSSDSSRSLLVPTPTRRKEAKFVVASSATDETSRADILSDLNLSNDSGFITASEEFDPEEREAFVDDVYADDHLSNKRRHDYLEDEQERSVQNDDDNEDDDELDKK